MRRLAAEAHDGKYLDVRGNLEFPQVLRIGLKQVRLQRAADLIDQDLQRMLRHGDAQYSWRGEGRELRRLARRDLARTGREDKADRIDIRSLRCRDRIDRRDTAYLDPHPPDFSHVRACSRGQP